MSNHVRDPTSKQSLQGFGPVVEHADECPKSAILTLPVRRRDIRHRDINAQPGMSGNVQASSVSLFTLSSL